MKPQEMAERLGLASPIDLAELSDRRLPYKGIHMGTQDIPIGRVLDLLKSVPALKPPRTGHIGNWTDIALGRAGAMDFNKAICASGYGYPFIYGFTQTESENPPRGDHVYLPGSLVENGRHDIIPLYHWTGKGFDRAARDRPYLCPLVQAEVDGGLVPLVELHWSRMKTIPGFHFRLQSAVMNRNSGRMRDILTILLEEASSGPNPRSAFTDLISHAVAKDGTVARCNIRREAGGYWLDDYYYPSTASLVEHALILDYAVVDPRRFLSRLAELPPVLPLVASTVLGMVLGALFASHYPDVEDSGGLAGLLKPFNLHMQWGARDMAGFPPDTKGYFSERSRRRSLKWICTTLLKHFRDIDPLCIVALPASVFMLCPSSAHPRDAELLADLFKEIRAATMGLDSPAFEQQLHDGITRITRSWRERQSTALSAYFLNRFRRRSGVLHPGELPVSSEPVEADGFRGLTFRQACMIVGALHGPAQEPAE